MANWSESPLVDKIVKDPASPEKVVVFKGFVGPGPLVVTDPGPPAKSVQAVRVYLNHAFTDYYEIENEADILYQVTLAEDEGARVWVKHGAKIKLVRTRPSTAELPSLLEGPVSQAHLTQVPFAVPRWAPPWSYGVPGGVPRAGVDWSPAEDPFYEVTKCYNGCASYSP